MTPTVRVAVIARSVRPLHGQGGLEQSVYDLVRHLAARHADVTLVTAPATNESIDDRPFGAARITVRSVPYVTFPFANRRGTTILDRSTAYPLFGWRAGRVVRDLARAGMIDVVHAFGASGLGYALGRRSIDPPLVINPQGLEEFGASAAHMPVLKRWAYAPLRAAVRATANRAATIIATDTALEPVVARHLQPRSGQMVTIPNGIDLTTMDALATPADGLRIRRQHGIGDDDIVLLSVGRLEHNKGFDLLARALAREAQPGGALAGRRWHWVVVGAGPYRTTIEREVQSGGLTGNVLFVGRATGADLHAWYEGATLFVHPTRYEGSSLVTLEAMAHRRAIVATRAGGLPDKVSPGVNGWLVDVDSVEALAAGVAEALADRADLLRMGSASRSIVERRFSWTVLADQYLSLYASLRALRQNASPMLR